MYSIYVITTKIYHGMNAYREKMHLDAEKGGFLRK